MYWYDCILGGNCMSTVSEKCLRELYGDVSPVAAVKTISSLDKNCMKFIANSTFCILATSDGTALDVSPKGDPAGFVKVVDAKSLIIPDRPGNNRIDGLINLLKHPNVGMLFLIPTIDETLRVNGTAEIIMDSKVCKDYALNGRVPKTVTKITVNEVFMHCGKAPLRAGLWKTDTWSKKRPLPNLYEIVKGHAKGQAVPDLTQEEIQKMYEKTLY